MEKSINNSVVIHNINSKVKIVGEVLPHYYSFTLGLFINRGSRDEAKEDNGSTHLIEHMLFKGTSRKSALEIVRMIEGLGGSFDAFTTKENLVIVTRFLSEHFIKVFELIGEILLESRFGEDEFSKEKSVIIEEIKSNNEDPAEYVYDLMFEAIFKNHPMAMPIAGNIESVSGLRLENVYQAYQRLLKSQIVIAVSGNFNIDDLLESARARFAFGEMVSNERINPGVYKPQRVFQTRSDISQVHLVFGVPAVAYSSNLRYPLLILTTVLGGGMSSRLFQGLREEKGLVYDVHSFIDFYSDCGVLGFYLTADIKNLDKIIEQLKTIFGNLNKTGFGKDEINIAKTYVTGNFLLSLENSTNRMLRIGREVSYLNKTVSIDETVRLINKIEEDEIKALINTYLDLDRYSIAAVGPIDEKIIYRINKQLKV
ncbi:MAG: M16 family metallopeptidase [bacterium]